MRELLAVICIMLVPGCAPAATNGAGGPGDDRIDLSVDRGQYRAGDTMMITLRNGSPDRIGYNLCPVALERRVNAEWQESPQRLAEVCTLELRILDPGGSDTYQHTVPRGLTPGEYRVRTAVEAPLGDAQIGIASQPFQITN